MANARLFYFRRYQLNSADAQTNMDIPCVGKTEEAVEAKLNELKDSADSIFGRSYSKVLAIEVDEALLAGDSVWVVSYNDPLEPEFSDLRFIGESKEQCLNWWSKNWQRYCFYGKNGDVPLFTSTLDESWTQNNFICKDSRMYGESVSLKQIYLI